jgi:hypothetical protein
MRFVSRILPLWLGLRLVLAQDAETGSPTGAPTSPEWGGCVDPDDREALVTVGKKTTICLVLGDGIDWAEPRTYMRLHFQPIADDYSRFHVPNCT